MADRKISDLTALTAQASGDLIPIVDVSEAAAADKNKSITIQELFRDIPVSVGVGTSSPGALLELSSSSTPQIFISNTSDSIGSGDTIATIDYRAGSSNTVVARMGATADSANEDGAHIVFENRTGGGGFSEKVRIDSDGRLLVGTTTNSSPGGFNAKIQIADTSYTGSLSLRRDSDNNAAQSIVFGKSRGALNGNTIVQDDDILGYVSWFGADGTDLNSEAARISAHVDGTPGENDMPGRLVFSTTADGQQAPTERMRIDSAGNVGIGATPAAWDTDDGLEAIQLNSYDALWNYYNNVQLAFNAYQSSTGGKYLTADEAAMYTLDSGGNHVWYTASSGSANSAISWSERARIDNSGRLLVGTSSSPSVGDGQYARIVVQGYTGGASAQGYVALARGEAASTITSGEEIGTIAFTDSSGYSFAYIGCSADADAGSGDYPGRLVFSTTRDGASSPTGRMRIRHSGIIGTFADNTTDAFIISSQAAAGTSIAGINVRHSATGPITGTTSFQVFTNGNVQNTNNSYGAISDIKLKENFVDASSQWDDIKDLRVRNYNFIEGQTHTQLGVVAQEVETVSPGLVTESPDRDEEGNASS